MDQIKDFLKKLDYLMGKKLLNHIYTMLQVFTAMDSSLKP